MENTAKKSKKGPDVTSNVYTVERRRPATDAERATLPHLEKDDSMPTDEHWFVAYVKTNREKKVAEQLQALGVEHFLPVQRVKRKWSDRIKVMDVLVLHGHIFLHITDKRRRELFNEIDGIHRYMTDGNSHAITIPDQQMAAFIMMVQRSTDNVTFETIPLAPGDHVRIIDGPLEGWEGELVTVQGKTRLAVRLEMLGAATVEVSLDVVTRIEEQKTEDNQSNKQ